MMNLADPELELIDPTPNVHAMFLHLDKTFFWSKLSSRCVVRWSKRMFSCAGTCTYEGRGGLCDIALSEPLLKLRPRKDLVETLLHEMIHAYLFVTSRDQDRDGHGPNFQAHMHRINRAAGLNISIYHDFHDEVELYQTHWWRCNGPCQLHKPHFGIVRRTNNRAPGPSDYWWNRHQKNCGGIFIKIKEPNKPEKRGKKVSVINVTKPNADITKYFKTNNNNKEVNNKNIIQNDKTKKPVLKDSSNVLVASNIGMKSNNSNTVVVTNKNIIFNPQVPKSKPVVFSGTGLPVGSKQSNNGVHKITSSTDVLQTVRNIWSNKQIGTNIINQVSKDNTSIIVSNRNKQKPVCNTESPAPEAKKIDDYFKTAASSVLKDLYGQDFNITQSTGDQKLKAIPTKNKLVDCPVCNSKIDSIEINSHLDECLNKGLIEKFPKKSTPVVKNEPYLNITNVDNCQDRGNYGEKAATVVPKTGIRNIEILNESKDHNLATSVVHQGAINANDLADKIFSTGLNRKRPRTSFDNLGTNKQIMDSNDMKHSKVRKSDGFKCPTKSNIVQSSSILINTKVKTEPGCSKTALESACPCCGDKLNKSVDEHLDECVTFFEDNTTIPNEGASTSYGTIVIDDDDVIDESQTFNATGTKLPCPCCLIMIEEIDMNNHLDECLS